jgi:hypothetical protein
VTDVLSVDMIIDKVVVIIVTFSKKVVFDLITDVLVTIVLMVKGSVIFLDVVFMVEVKVEVLVTFEVIVIIKLLEFSGVIISIFVDVFAEVLVFEVEIIDAKFLFFVEKMEVVLVVVVVVVVVVGVVVVEVALVGVLEEVVT